jgi:hypothetical protein
MKCRNLRSARGAGRIPRQFHVVRHRANCAAREPTDWISIGASLFARCDNRVAVLARGGPDMSVRLERRNNIVAP